MLKGNLHFVVEGLHLIWNLVYSCEFCSFFDLCNEYCDSDKEIHNIPGD
jgi:hypothetical protein